MDMQANRMTDRLLKRLSMADRTLLEKSLFELEFGLPGESRAGR